MTAGLLLHPTSLPGAPGCGDLGQGARDFVHWMAEAGFSWWQVLPLGMPDPVGLSPYASPASFWGSPMLISLEDLEDGTLLPTEAPPSPDPNRVTTDWWWAHRWPRIEAAALRLANHPEHPLHSELTIFEATEQPWLDDAVRFMVLRRQYPDQPWWRWPQPLRKREKNAIEQLDAETHAAQGQLRAVAFLFDHQWNRLRRLAAAHGIRILGDVPIYVHGDSADVWANQEIFALEPGGGPIRYGGVPPDAFSATGQVWEMPVYDWAASAHSGHRWWCARLRRALDQADAVRLDHFRGFSAFYSVSPNAPDGGSGSWENGPGIELFHTFQKTLKIELSQRLVAEDLGRIDDAVIALRQQTGLMGTRVLQFGFDEDPNNIHLPRNTSARDILYTSTHDNDTLFGWWSALSAADRAAVANAVAQPAHTLPQALLDAVWSSAAGRVMVPVQDLLGLDSAARMNTPATRTGNWSWRLQSNALSSQLATEIRLRLKACGR